MNDDGAGEGIWKDEEAQRVNGKRLSSVENYTVVESFGSRTQTETAGYHSKCFISVSSQHMSCGTNQKIIYFPQ